MDFKLEIYKEIDDIYNDNVDFFITLNDGRKFTGTFFTLKNIEYLMENGLRGNTSGRSVWLLLNN